MSSLEALFCAVDNCCQQFEPKWQSELLATGIKIRKRAQGLCLSKKMTLLIAFHHHHYRNFKHFYLDHVCLYLGEYFPGLPSYQHFVEYMPSTLLPLCVYLKHCFGKCTGISFMDATSLKVCHNRRIFSHKVFDDLPALQERLAIWLNQLFSDVVQTLTKWPWIIDGLFKAGIY